MTIDTTTTSPSIADTTHTAPSSTDTASTTDTVDTAGRRADTADAASTAGFALPTIVPHPRRASSDDVSLAALLSSTPAFSSLAFSTPPFPPPPAKAPGRGRAWIIVLAIVGLLVIAATSVAAIARVALDRETTHPPRGDVDGGWSCAVEGDAVRARGTITNHSSKTSFYLLDVEFRVDGRQVEARGVAIDDVDSGETALVEVSASLESLREHVDGELTCAVGDIERFKA